MARSVILACNLNELTDFTFIRQQNDVDGSFLINCILGQNSLIQNAGAILVCLHHTFEHYAIVGKRLGFNLNNSRSKGSLLIIDAIRDIANEIQNSKSFTILIDTLVNNILKDIEIKVEKLLKEKASVVVILDDVSALSYLKASENLLIGLCRRLQMLSKVLAPKLHIVVKLHNSNLFEHLSNNISDLAELEIQVNKLPSGHSKEVDGTLFVKKKESAGGKSVLYKVNERNIVVMQPGEPGVNIG